MSAPTVPPRTSGPAGAPPGRRSPRTSVVAVVIVCVAVVVVALVVALWPSGNRATGPSASPTPTAASSQVVPVFRYMPLWPFQTVGEASAWQESHRTSGAEPWHLDPSETAVRFAHDFLGYTEIDRVAGTVVRSGGEALVPVGAAPVEGQARPAAAVLHLAQIGSGADAPWEVVGSRDTTLTLTTPPYGSSVLAPVTVGGRITGVDENLQVQVRDLSGVLGRAENIPAGGLRTPWSATVGFSAPSGTVLTVAVSTGGHVSAVERFAITGVRTA